VFVGATGILYHPFGGLSKNIGLLARAAAVYRLAPFKNCPRKPSRVAIETTKGWCDAVDVFR
jgi:hypothetical protein